VSIQALCSRMKEYLPGADLELVQRAYEFSRQAHWGQFRESGERYIEHPLQVALILAELELDLPTIVAGLLHDVVEDTECTLDEVRKVFGGEVADLVDGVTKLGRLENRTRLEERAENLRKMLLAMARDIRVIFIKLADRLHNMRTLEYLPPERRQDIAEETLEIYAPLAHRLGVWHIKAQLEDLAFKHRQPEEYRRIARELARARREREAFTERMIAQLRQRLDQAGIKGEIQGRVKHLYSIYRKMRSQSKSLNEIYDKTAIRVVVDTVRDCYAVLGIVHSLWKPIPGRFKDYIAMPKSNMYQSLHTTVMSPDGEPFEIQIRTHEMHRTAEYGIAAHWRYKEGGKTDTDFDAKLTWLRQVLEWQRELKDAKEFMESLKIDLFQDEVFVFTPKGDVVDLPAGSTPVDFAYRIHTEVGHSCVGAKVNGRMVPLDYQLQSGDIVEIMTSKVPSGPSADWLSFVKTSSARSRIRGWFKRQRRQENIARGREMLEREARRQGLDPQRVLSEEWLEDAAGRLNYHSAEDLLAAVGFGSVTPQQLVNRFREEHAPAKAEEPALPDKPGVVRSGARAVKIEGLGNVLVRFARCCSPLPGDPIVGYVTRGRGISIHRRDCSAVAQFAKNPDRLMSLSWDGIVCSSYAAEVAVTAMDRPRLLSDVAQVVADMHTNILAARGRATSGNRAVIDLVLEVRDLEQLDRITKRLERVKDVIRVERVSRGTIRS